VVVALWAALTASIHGLRLFWHGRTAKRGTSQTSGGIS
jgi:hypothetical protein